MFREMMRTSQPTQTEGPAESGTQTVVAAARPDSAAVRDEGSVEEEIVRMEGEISAALARLDRWEQSAHMMTVLLLSRTRVRSVTVGQAALHHNEAVIVTLPAGQLGQNSPIQIASSAAPQV